MRGLRGSIVAAVLISSLLIVPALPGESRGEVGDLDEVAGDIQERVLFLGFFNLDVEGGGENVMPFGTLESHGVLGGEYFSTSDFGLLDLNLNYNTEQYYDFQGHLQTGSVTVDLDAERFIRNLDHRNLPLASDTSSAPLYTPDDRNPGDDYWMDVGEQSVLVKWKIPTYPAHVRVSARRYTMEGEKQQVFLNENCATNCHNVSETRKIDTVTQQLGVGADVHFGYVDISYDFKTTIFEDNMADPVFTYGAIVSTLGTLRATDSFPHNAYPDVTSVEHTLNISTNLTGRWTGGLGLVFGERENEDSDLKEDYRKASTYLTWRPSDRILVSAATRQTLRQDDAPSAGSAAAVERINDGLPLEYGTLKTRYRASVTYYPATGIKIRGKLGREEIEREDEESWSLPDETSTDLWGITGRVRYGKNWMLRLEHEDRSTTDPQYPTTPTDRSRTTLGVQWRPRPNVMVVADVKDICDENSESGHENKKLFFNGGVTYSPIGPVSLGFHYFRFEDDVDTNLTYDGAGGTIVTDTDVPYRARGDQYLIRASWVATEHLQLESDFSYLDAEGAYDARDPNFDDVGLYSILDVVQRESSLGVRYSFRRDWELSVRLARLEYEDQGALITDETIDKVGAVVSKRW